MTNVVRAYEYLFYSLYYLFNKLRKNNVPEWNAMFALSVIIYFHISIAFVIISKGIPYFMRDWNPRVLGIIASIVLFSGNWYLLLRNNRSKEIIKRYKKRAKMNPNRDAYIGAAVMILGLSLPFIYIIVFFDYVYK